MKTFQTGSKEYQMCEKWLELDVDSLAAKLAKQGAQAQMVAIDTMYQIIATDRRFDRSSAGTLSTQIRNGQRERINSFGSKAFGLSEKQIAVVAGDIDRLTDTWIEEA